MFPVKPQLWIRICIFNLLIVAGLGVVMRFKAGFSFPWLNQKYLQEGHSHFAFSGWVTLLLMVLMVESLGKSISKTSSTYFNRLFIAYLICAYGMVITFVAEGYGPFSLFFSTASLVISFLFTYIFFKEIQRQKTHPGRNWFLGALLFNLLSTLGTGYLSVMMASGHPEQHAYLASVFWYLHFQYNGLFLFSCIGLFIHYIQDKYGIVPDLYTVFRLIFFSCIPAYGLSVLWMDLPIWVYVLIVTATVSQFFGWILFLRKINSLFKGKDLLLGRDGIIFIYFSAAALTIKFLLQLSSTVPQISQFAFGFRPIVIAYLHLVLLAGISGFLLAYIFLKKFLTFTKTAKISLYIFFIGILLNESILAV